MSQSRKSKRKSLSNSSPTPASESQQAFAEALDELAVIGGFSNHVSIALVGLPTNRAGELASMVHAKMCAHGRSIGAICKSSMFDHSAIISLGRMMMDGMTMYFYLLEKITDDEWALRYLVLRLHDTVARIKLIRASKPKSEYADLTAGRLSLVEEIKQSPCYGLLNTAQQERVVTGEEIFVGGMRHAATRVGGWREETFLALYNYFSAHMHTAPMSYMRMRTHTVDYFAASEAQYASARMAMIVSVACLRRVSLHCLDRQPGAHSQFSTEHLASVRQQDADCNVFSHGG